MRIPISAVSALVTFAYVIIVGFIWRWLATQFADKPLGKAMSYLY